MNNHTVEKIGGTSIADTDAVIDNVLIGDRKGDELFNRIFVVSAYANVTDRLLEHKNSDVPGVYSLFANAGSEWAWSDAVSEVLQFMLQINADIFSHDGNRQIADRFVRERIEGVRRCLIDLQQLCSYGHFNLPAHLHTVREMLASIGEAHSAHNTALLLNQLGTPARFIDLTGWRDNTTTDLDEGIVAALADIDIKSVIPVVTGYAHSETGLVREFDRGYSEVTFSRIAVSTWAREAIVHKEFHLLSADPGIVDESRLQPIGRTNYDVADHLSNMGMEAIHPSAAKCLRQAGIPLRIKNTFDPLDVGTVISGDYVSESPRAEIITGIREAYALEFFEQDMVRVKGYDAQILESLRRRRVRVITKSSNANTIVHYVEGSHRKIESVITDLSETYKTADIRSCQVSIVTAIGSDLNVQGLTENAVEALSSAGIEILGVHQLLRNVDIIFIVKDADYCRAIGKLHEALVEKSGSKSDSRKSATRAA